MEKLTHLTAKYEEYLDKTLPWNEYPRPSLVRDSFFNLNGSWDFAVNKNGAPEYTQKILVPFPPESRLSGISAEIPTGSVMYYKRRFSLPDGFISSRVILHFGAVDTICKVILNGNIIGTHEGGYLPFSFDITDFLLPENELCVIVRDDLDKKYPYGKQTKKRGGMWYTPVSGIWQTVWIESVPENYIKSIDIDTDMTSAKITVLGGAPEKRLTIEETGDVFEFTGDSIPVTPSVIKQWSADEPYLYNFTLESGDDKVRGYFALREISVREIGGVFRLTLNGEPYLFNGLLDQGYFPDGIFLPATYHGFLNDILMAKKLGFNMLRKHIKVEPEIFYNLCDRLGMVVFQDMVNNGDYSFILDTALPTVGLKRLPDNMRHRDKEAREIFEKEMLATIKHTKKFPSVLYYTVFNEGWGQFTADKMYTLAKAAAPTRIIDATSGWFTRKKSDVDSRHIYFKPVKIKGKSDRPIVISEFGGYSHRVKGHLATPDNYGYKLYESMEDFEKGFFALYENEILPQIKKGISALVYTQVSDVEDETNGLITYDRQVLKLDAEKTNALMKRLYIKTTEKNK